jgi:transposase
LCLALAVVLLIAAVQCGFWARQYAVTPSQILEWWPDFEDPDIRQQVRGQQWGHQVQFDRWSNRARRTYAAGILALSLAVVLVLVPKTSFRSFGVGLAGSGAMTTLADDLVPEQLWAIVEPLLPAPPRPPDGGRHRTISDRACLAAIVYMARTSTPWRLLPARELGCGSPATCWRRLTEWANAGVFDQLRLQVLDRLGQRGQLDWSQVSVDTMSVRAKRGGTTWAQIQSIVASLEPSCSWPATPAGCR